MKSCSRKFGCFGGLAEILTLFFSSAPINTVLSVSGLYVTNGSPFERAPVIASPSNTTSLTEPSRTHERNVEYSVGLTRGLRTPKLLTTDHRTTATTIQRMTFFARSFKALPRGGHPGR